MTELLAGKQRAMVLWVEPNVGIRLRQLREQRGLSLRELAEKCGLSAFRIPAAVPPDF
ncbi:MAG: helix-turn-helix transcriptional regulator [Chloroflexi bacterium]|nr:helix-turn-helix transcriptional regulator [Chloroflexota bacterium]